MLETEHLCGSCCVIRSFMQWNRISSFQQIFNHCSETIVLVKAQVRVEFTGSDVLEKKKMGHKLNTNIRLEKKS